VPNSPIARDTSADVDLEGAGVDFGEELAPEPGAQQPENRDQAQHGAQDHHEPAPHHPVVLAGVPAVSGLDHPLAPDERAGA
jgi:hypothetical protein